MPRIARVVFDDIPHHITQRGNRRADVFFEDADRTGYLDLLHGYYRTHNVDVLAYCLMRNHVHIIAVPKQSNGLQRVFNFPVGMGDFRRDTASVPRVRRY